MLPVMSWVDPVIVIWPVVKHWPPREPGSGYCVPAAEQIRNCQCVLAGVTDPLAILPYKNSLCVIWRYIADGAN